MGDMLILLTAAFTVYLSVIMGRRIHAVALKETYRKVYRYELAVCTAFLLLALDMRFGFLTKADIPPLRIPGRAVRISLRCMAAVVLFLAGKVILGSFIRTAGSADSVIVLGQALEKGRPTADLLSRLDTAREYLAGHPDAVLILTGGNPDETGRTEAAVMRELLTERGVPEEKLVLEDRAETTRDNFRNTAEMIDPRRPVVLISSDYHMDRAVRTAREAGFTRVLRLPAPSSFLSFGANVMWEVIMEVNERTFKI